MDRYSRSLFLLLVVLCYNSHIAGCHQTNPFRPEGIPWSQTGLGSADDHLIDVGTEHLIGQQVGPVQNAPGPDDHPNNFATLSLFPVEDSNARSFPLNEAKEKGPAGQSVPLQPEPQENAKKRIAADNIEQFNYPKRRRPFDKPQNNFQRGDDMTDGSREESTSTTLTSGVDPVNQGNPSTFNLFGYDSPVQHPSPRDPSPLSNQPIAGNQPSVPTNIGSSSHTTLFRPIPVRPRVDASPMDFQSSPVQAADNEGTRWDQVAQDQMNTPGTLTPGIRGDQVNPLHHNQEQPTLNMVNPPVQTATHQHPSPQSDQPMGGNQPSFPMNIGSSSTSGAQSDQVKPSHEKPGGFKLFGFKVDPSIQHPAPRTPSPEAEPNQLHPAPSDPSPEPTQPIIGGNQPSFPANIGSPSHTTLFRPTPVKPVVDASSGNLQTVQAANHEGTRWNQVPQNQMNTPARSPALDHIISTGLSPAVRSDQVNPLSLDRERSSAFNLASEANPAIQHPTPRDPPPRPQLNHFIGGNQPAHTLQIGPTGHPTLFSLTRFGPRVNPSPVNAQSSPVQAANRAGTGWNQIAMMKASRRSENHEARRRLHQVQQARTLPNVRPIAQVPREHQQAALDSHVHTLQNVDWISQIQVPLEHQQAALASHVMANRFLDVLPNEQWAQKIMDMHQNGRVLVPFLYTLTTKLSEHHWERALELWKTFWNGYNRELLKYLSEHDMRLRFVWIMTFLNKCIKTESVETRRRFPLGDLTKFSRVDPSVVEHQSNTIKWVSKNEPIGPIQEHRKDIENFQHYFNRVHFFTTTLPTEFSKNLLKSLESAAQPVLMPFQHILERYDGLTQEKGQFYHDFMKEYQIPAANFDPTPGWLPFSKFIPPKYNWLPFSKFIPPKDKKLMTLRRRSLALNTGGSI